MTEPRVAPYGSWRSPITSDLVSSGTIRLEQTIIDGEDIYWIEMRPAEGGRYVVVRWSPEGRMSDVVPPPFNARTRVHEYGGGSFLVVDGMVYFSNFSDQRLCRLDGDQPCPITPSGYRYADGIIDRHRQRMIWVCEDHTVAGSEALNYLTSIGLRGEDQQVLVSGNDFYSSPRLSPDGSCLAWLTWNHPEMPWDGTELLVGELEADGSVGRTEHIAGGADESIFQPEWSPDGVLHFVSDRTGWWNLCRWHEGRIEPLFEMEAEFGCPQWVFGLSTYAFESEDHLVCAYSRDGTWHLASHDAVTHELETIEIPYTEIAYLRAAPGRVVFVGGSPTEPPSVVRLDLSRRQVEEVGVEVEVLRRSSKTATDVGYLSMPQAVEFPTGVGLTAHAFFYPPRNRDYVAFPGERPPLLVMSHGGPTSAASSTLDLKIQYWTSRGIAVLDVNYGGSTGYGRAYRSRLEGQWGIVDVDDCVNGALYLVERGWADGDRLIIRGGSAGGYTTLSALVFRNVFGAGASYYGISDLEVLTRDTHKFESHYLDRLVGPYPERRDIYRERSPINFVDQLSSPVIFFQGLEDRVVLPDQAEKIFEAVCARKLPAAYIAFEGEQHGFRRAENIKRAIEAELYFYSRVFGFEIVDPVEPVPIENL